MLANYGLILAAGMGSRMGDIGKLLPKPLWPIFEKTLLDLQITYLCSLGVSKIFVNTHHCHEQIHSHLTNIQRNDIDIEILHEPNLLDVGGAVHNLARQSKISYKGTLLILNSDQFLEVSQDVLERCSRLCHDHKAVLIAINVGNSQKYNRLILDSRNMLVSVVPPSSTSINPYTYSGVSFVNLSKLDKVEGKSSFFKTVATADVAVEKLDSYSYWDFGTVENYLKSHFGILEAIGEQLELAGNGRFSLFFDFCVKHNFIETKKINPKLKSYGNTKTKNFINLSSNEANGVKPGFYLVLKSGSQNEYLIPGVYYEDMFANL